MSYLSKRYNNAQYAVKPPRRIDWFSIFIVTSWLIGLGILVGACRLSGAWQ